MHQCVTEFRAFRRGGEAAEPHSFSFSFLHVLKLRYHGQGDIFSLAFWILESKIHTSPLRRLLNWVYVCMLTGWITTKYDFHVQKPGLVILKLVRFRVCFQLSKNIVSRFELIWGSSITSSVLSAVVQAPTHRLAMCGESRFQAVPLSPGKHNTQRYVTRQGGELGDRYKHGMRLSI